MNAIDYNIRRLRRDISRLTRMARNYKAIAGKRGLSAAEVDRCTSTAEKLSAKAEGLSKELRRIKK